MEAVDETKDEDQSQGSQRDQSASDFCGQARDQRESAQRGKRGSGIGPFLLQRHGFAKEIDAEQCRFAALPREMNFP